MAQEAEDRQLGEVEITMSAQGRIHGKVLGVTISKRYAELEILRSFLLARHG